jgi:hypothetical protein
VLLPHHTHAPAQELRAREAHLAALVSSEMGKPLAQARAEVRAAAARVATLAAAAPDALAPRTAHAADDGALTERVELEALGVVGAISAWNYPVFLATNVAASALLAGNAVLFKPSELAPRAGGAVADALRAAGVHGALFATLPHARAYGRALAAQPGLGCVFAFRALITPNSCGHSRESAVRACVLCACLRLSAQCAVFHGQQRHGPRGGCGRGRVRRGVAQRHAAAAAAGTGRQRRGVRAR